MGDTTHATLLARLADGVDPAAWREFHDRYADLLRGFARRYGLQPADCDDATQEILLALAKSVGKFQYDPAKGKFRSYLKTVALRTVFRILRQKKAARTLELSGEEVDAAAGDSATEEYWEQEWRQYHVRRAMRRLESEFNEQHRMVFSHYAVKGLPASKTAAELGLSVDQVYQAKSRILRRLSALIAEQIEEEG